MTRSLLLLLSPAMLLLAGCNKALIQDVQPYVLMISFDGFRYDYVQDHDMPHFEEFIETGASAERLLPSFPSKTFPNHYTLVTGMYPGRHGLVDNTFYCPDLEKGYAVSNREAVENPNFYGGTPLWQLAQSQGLKAASYFWVGSEAPIQGMYPDYYYRYDEDVPNKERVDQVMEWLRLPEAERPRLISLYFSFIDTQGHQYGGESEEIAEALQEADALLGSIMEKLQHISLPVNVIVVSDHGMYTMEESVQTIISSQAITEKLADADIKAANGGSQLHIYTKDQAQAENIYQILKADKGAYDIYTRQQFPEDWHYEHTAAGDLLLTAKPGFYFKNLSQEEIRKRYAQPAYAGVHGYDPDVVDEMGGIFYAHGPQIKAGKRLPAFRNIHVYPLVAQLLGLSVPKDIDGRGAVLQSIIKK
ncbi:putative AlkP superfamily pyrophosphatase or phosphodiesterase [Catalinimonas alkaloidigena]|uniref:alkaline phosphatase family protein n=1 Tax=Catalinimonas alkaloidigena TaxID=1075417 RepID=UPI0024053B44|nr:ectonucleotide pyrophosphatase/phosphodiesterase [Catalinimonas alkaloidigena]MDF9800763.1 putative AlkP superfamily pyrophosphatase or phosphodiesterase [Catalinimonas alkaloidigena]